MSREAVCSFLQVFQICICVDSFEHEWTSFQIINVVNTILINWDNYCLIPLSFILSLDCLRWYLIYVIARVLLIDRVCICAHNSWMCCCYKVGFCRAGVILLTDTWKVSGLNHNVEIKLTEALFYDFSQIFQ